MQMVDRGDSLEVARYCQAIPSSAKRWRWECHFKAAETFLARDLRNYPIAVEHCLVANEYSGRCVTVLNKTLAKSSPPADKNDWTQSVKLAEQIKEVWKPYGKEVTNHILGSFWGFSLLHSYRIAKTITGDPFDHLPTEVIPHIHAAAAYEFLLVHRRPLTYQTSSINYCWTIETHLPLPPSSDILTQPYLTFGWKMKPKM